MRIENPMRLGGLAALLAGVLLFISELLYLPLDFLPLEISGDELAISGYLGINGYLGVLLAVLMHLGLVGLYAPQAKAAGSLGVVGFIIAFAGTRAVMSPSFVDPILIKPSEWPSARPEEFWGALVSFGLTFVLGWVLFGVATLRTGVYPRVAGALLVAGALIFLLPLPFSGLIFAVTLAWMGYVLFAARTEEAREDLRTRIEDPVRWGGLAALVAGILLVVSLLLRLYLIYLDPGANAEAIFPADPLLGLLLGVLMQLGLVGLYASQARTVGFLGLAGFFAAFTGAWLRMGGSLIVPFGKPFDLPPGEPEEFWGPLVIFGLTFVLGWVLFGVAMLRAGIYPRVVAGLLIVGALVLLLPLLFSDVIFAVAVAWIGYVLFTERRGTEEVARHARV